MTTYNLTELSRSEYERALRSYLQLLIDTGAMSTGFLGRGFDLEGTVQDALGRYDLYGPGEHLPMYREVAQYRSQSDWNKQYQKDVEQWKKDVSEATQNRWENQLARAKWMSDVQATNEQLMLNREKFEADKLKERRDWGMQQAALGTEQERNRQTARANALQAETYRIGGSPRAKFEADLEDLERRKQEMAFEEMRSSILGEIQGKPRYWAQEQMLKQMPNRYARQPETPQEALVKEKAAYQSAVSEFKAAKEEEKNARAAWKDLAGRAIDEASGYPMPPELEIALGRVQNATNQRNYWAEQVTQRDTQLKGGQGVPAQPGSAASYAQPHASAGGFGMEIGEPTAPTPAWKPTIPTDVAPFLQKNEFGSQVVTPSGQQWMAASPTVKEKVLGYADVIGQPSADIEADIIRRRTNTPNIAYRWSPARG